MLHPVPVLSGSTRISDLQPTAVNAILAEMRIAQAQGKSLVSLMRGEPDFPTPPHIVEASIRALRNGRTSYPDNRGEKIFREAAAQKLQRDNRLTFDPSNEILATTGATQGVYAALMAMLNEGDEVLLPDPVYDAYQSPIRMAGGRIKSVQSEIREGRFVITEEALERAWSAAAKAIVLNTPWNPVGTVLRRDEIETITAFCERHNLFLISDEIYEAITYGEAVHVSPLEVAPGLRDRSVLVNSLSKTYSMTGWRVGYCAGPAPLIHAMFLVLAQSSRGPATFIQDAAAEALTGSQDCVAAMREEYTRRRSQVIEQLPGVRVIAPEGGFFAMVDVRESQIPSNEIRKRLLYEHGVVVVHGAAYGAGGEGTLRVSFASGGENLARGLDRLREGLSH
ncbi:MAG TPA: aminotransferase class I/II-fold pyridoxal phosphate-dependent enzyme [Bryobacteraceae bacterium]|nr:aminotransferase class I/II-fold pyridoxal phosphate-dependent enzyme [Bryobacteraceae bacterium]